MSHDTTPGFWKEKNEGHLISYVHVQKEAGTDNDSVHEGGQSPYRQP